MCTMLRGCSNVAKSVKSLVIEDHRVSYELGLPTFPVSRTSCNITNRACVVNLTLAESKGYP